MIFVTVGTQLPFDRLVKTVDWLAPGLGEPVFGQIGQGGYRPENFEAADDLTPMAFEEKFKKARLIIGHAGIGTILSGFNFEKPLLLLARRASLGEHRNDHQLATIRQMRTVQGIYAADKEEDLAAFLKDPDLQPMRRDASPRRDALITSLRSEILSAR